MTKKTSLFIVGSLALLLCTLPDSARAEIMDTTEARRPGQISLASEFQAMASPGNFMVNFHEAVGLLGGLTLVLRQGLGVAGTAVPPLYLGAGIKYTPLKRSKKRPGIALFAGGHWWQGRSAGADATLLIDYRISSFIPYGGLDYNLEFEDRGAISYLTLLLGLRYVIHRYVSWFVEGGPEFIQNRHFISTGPRVYF